MDGLPDGNYLLLLDLTPLTRRDSLSKDQNPLGINFIFGLEVLDGFSDVLIDEFRKTVLIVRVLRLRPILAEIRVYSGSHSISLSTFATSTVTRNIDSNQHSGKVIQRKVINRPRNHSQLSPNLNDHLIDDTSQSLVLSQSRGQNHLRRNRKLIDQKSLDLIVVNPSLFLTRKNPKADSDTLVEILLSSLLDVSFVSHLINPNIFDLIEFHLVIVQNLFQHVDELLAIIVALLLVKDHNVTKVASLEHLSLSVPVKVATFSQRDFLVVSED